MTIRDVFAALVVLGLLLIIGNAVHRSHSVWRKYFIPGSILAGAVGLLLGPEVLGALVRPVAGPDHVLSGGVIPENIRDVWSQIPGVFINVVFATLFLGKQLPTVAEMWRLAKPQIMFGQTMAWGQYVVGILLAILVLTPLFGMNPLAGALIEISFEGGHGTAAGLMDTFEQLGFPEGADLALGLATFSLVAGTVLGTIIVNWGARTGQFGRTRRPAGPQAAGVQGAPEAAASGHGAARTVNAGEEPAAGAGRQSATGAGRQSAAGAGRQSAADAAPEPSVEALTLQFAYIGLSIAIGWVIQQTLIYIESMTTVPLGAPALMPYIPLFPLSMIGSIFVQLGVNRLGLSHMLHRPLIERISGTALDVTIVAALATLSLSVIGDNWAPFVLLALAGTLWNTFCFFVLAPRMFPEYWFERGIADYGQGMGVTVTGLLLLRLADPHNRSGTLETFGYKQLLFEPIVGGGIWTAAAMPLMHQFGPVPVLVFTGAVTVFWLVLGLHNGKAPVPAAQ